MFCTLYALRVWQINLFCHKCVYALTLAIMTNTRSTSATSSRFVHSLTHMKSNQIYLSTQIKAQRKQMMNDSQHMCEDKLTKSNGAHAQDRINYKSLCGVMCGYGTADLILSNFPWLMMRSPF